MTRRQLLLASLGPKQETVFSYGHENVLGTSLDLSFLACNEADAERAEAAALAEIDHLRAVLSTWDPTSEASQWLRTRNEPIAVSDDLWAVLSAYDFWRNRSGGLVDPAVAVAGELWVQGRVPSPAARAAAVTQIQQPHWLRNEANRTATRLSTTPQVFASLAKSYVLDRTAEAALATPILGAMINLGGDMVVRGDLSQMIDVRDPNEGTAARLAVRDRAVATSGDYRRGYLIGGRHYSHLLDPRTADTATAVRGATVIARDAVTAGALATAMAVAEVAEGERLARSVPDVEYLLLAANGRRISSPGWAAFAQAPPARPSDMELAVNFELARIDDQRYRRPYVAVWIEDSDKFPIRTLSFWVQKTRWWPDLKGWYRGDKLRSMAEGTEIAATIASATRAPGKYTVKWDGKDAKGQTVKPGKYAICIEAAREHGTYQLIRHEMEFNGTPKTVPLSGNVEIASASLEYRKTAR